MLKMIAGALFIVWLILVAMGKGGYIHLLLLNFFGLALTELAAEYRERMRL